MNYQVEIKDGKWYLYSPKIDRYVMEDATMNEVKIALATEMEYVVKLDIVKLLMTFPHGFSTMDDEVIVRQDAIDDYEAWYHKIQQRIGFPEEYHSLIDKKIREALT